MMIFKSACLYNAFRWALFNFIIMAAAGVLLRYMQLFPAGELNYLFILHSHSHFAFAGWMFLALGMLIVFQFFSKEWFVQRFRTIAVLTMICAFGMLFSFAYQGYKAISIGFSTMFLLITYWFAFTVYRDPAVRNNSITAPLIKGAVFFLCLSSIGPLMLGPIMVSGIERGTPLYQNPIYFYVHFQLNGWMLLASVGLLAATYLKAGEMEDLGSVQRWLPVFILSALPLFGIFTFWGKPPQWVYFIGYTGALLNMVSWFVLVSRCSRYVEKLSILAKTALLAVSLKVVLQVLICLPSVGDWVFGNRNLIIGYVHLITLGCITPVILDLFEKNGFFGNANNLKVIHFGYLAVVVLYLGLLFGQPLLGYFGILVPHMQICLLVISVMFVVAGLAYYKRVRF
ncbi:MAG TPA: hypothetical protein VGE26_01730 [Sphingobacteriaceae bacterium]